MATALGIGRYKPVVKSIGRVDTSAYDARRTTTLNDLAARGLSIAQQDARVAAARALDSSADYLRGFDVGVGVSGGLTDSTPETVSVRAMLASPHVKNTDGPQRAAFDVAQGLMFGITKQTRIDTALASVSPNPKVAVGELVINGIAGSALTSDQKGEVAGALVEDPAARVGTQSGIKQVTDRDKSLWDKILEFLGLGD